MASILENNLQALSLQLHGPWILGINSFDAIVPNETSAQTVNCVNSPLTITNNQTEAHTRPPFVRTYDVSFSWFSHGPSTLHLSSKIPISVHSPRFQLNRV